MYKVFKDGALYKIFVVDANGEKIGAKEIASFNREFEANVYCEHLQTAYEIGYKHGTEFGL